MNCFRQRQRLILFSILIVASVMLAAFYSAFPLSISTTSAVVMWPPHSHEGWPIQKTSSYSYAYTLHLQQELNYLDGKVSGFDINTLSEDGAYGSGTANAVSAYQTVRNLQVDGVVGNQTWSHLEFDVFQTWPTFRHPIGVGFRYPIYSQCRKITNNATAGLDIFVPILTESQWNAFRSNLPSGVSDALGDCNVSGGGGGGGDGEDPDGGTGEWTPSYCSYMHPSCCPAECGIACYGSIC